MADLFVRAREHASRRGTIPPLLHDLADVTQWLSGRLCTADVWLAEDPPGTLVGLLVLDGDLLDQLYVDPERTGNGIGARLLAVAKAERPGGLRLWTFASNEGAKRFYTRHGFVEITRTDGSANEERAPDIHYAWQPGGGQGASIRGCARG